MRSLADAMEGRDNNLTLLRLLAATAVVYTHAYGTSPITTKEPVERIFGAGLGHFGVDVFFFVSGLLICKSWYRHASLADFVWARVARIYPALWVSTLIFAFGFGSALSSLNLIEYLSHPSTWSYVLENSSMLPGIGAQIYLPGVFDGHAFNTPLWTLPHEIQMYTLLAVLGVSGLLRLRASCAILALFGLAQMVLHANGLSSYEAEGRSRFIFFFFSGALAYQYRDIIRVGHSLLFAGLAVTLVGYLGATELPVRRLALSLALPTYTLWFAYAMQGRIKAYNNLGDYSYGIYIYAFPVQMAIAGLDWGATPLIRFILAMVLVLPPAYFSWHFLESRALKLKRPRFPFSARA